MNRRWICNDVWMDILPSFDRVQLGLKIALLSPRFDALVDKHFGGKATELTIWRAIDIRKDNEQKPMLLVKWDSLAFPLPDRPLPNKIRFNYLHIAYIDHAVITFLNANKQIWDRIGTNLELCIAADDVQSIWDVFVHQIWPIFTPNIRHLYIYNGNHLDNLRRFTSPTMLTDLNQLVSICFFRPFPIELSGDDGPNATSAGQALYNWLHTPTIDGQPKRLRCYVSFGPPIVEWIIKLKEKFLRSTTTSASYKIRFGVLMMSTPIEPFELVNERTNEQLTLTSNSGVKWLLMRCPISGAETAAAAAQKDEILEDDWDAYILDHLHGVKFYLNNDCIGPLSPPGQSDEKVFSTPGPSSDQRKKKKK